MEIKGTRTDEIVWRAYLLGPMALPVPGRSPDSVRWLRYGNAATRGFEACFSARALCLLFVLFLFFDSTKSNQISEGIR